MPDQPAPILDLVNDGSARRPSVFVSYRRDDTAGYAGRLHDSLLTWNSGWRVFVDAHAIDPGLDFDQVITRAVKQADVIVALIGPDWLGEGGTRVLDSRDFVRREIAAGLSAGVPVVPVLVRDAELPTAAALPDDMAPLLRRQAVELRDETWQSDVERLARSLERFVGAPDPPLLDEETNTRPSTAASRPRRGRHRLYRRARATVRAIRPTLSASLTARVLGGSMTVALTWCLAFLVDRPLIGIVLPPTPASPGFHRERDLPLRSVPLPGASSVPAPKQPPTMGSARRPRRQPVSRALGASRALEPSQAPEPSRAPATTRHEIRRIEYIAPAYPASALAARIEGVVVLNATVDTRGRVIGARVVRSVPPLDKAALNAVKKWRYEPATANGVPVPTALEVEIAFELPSH